MYMYIYNLTSTIERSSFLMAIKMNILDVLDIFTDVKTAIWTWTVILQMTAEIVQEFSAVCNAFVYLHRVLGVQVLQGVWF